MKFHMNVISSWSQLFWLKYSWSSLINGSTSVSLLICNPQIFTLHGHLQIWAEVEQDNVLSSCPSSSYCKYVSFPWHSAKLFAFLCLLLVISLFTMAPRSSARVLCRINKTVICHTERKFFQAGVSVADLGCNAIQSITYIIKSSVFK